MYTYECDENGKLDNGQKIENLQDNDSHITRFAVTGGMLYRLATPVYLYGGAGYGWKEEYWGLDGIEADKYGNFVRDKNKSAKGIELEVGAIYRLAGFGFSAGVQTCAFKHWDISFGFGFMF